MKYLMLILSVLLAAAVQAEKPVRLKVMTYNLRFGELASLEQLAEFIKSEDPDLVALQELDWMTKRDRAPHQHDKDFITELGYRTNMFSLYGKTIPYAGGYYGIGLLTKKPYINIKKIILPKAEGIKEYRALLMAEIEITDADTIVFASTHLDYSTSGARIAQVKVITEALQGCGYPAIVGGDFNARPDSPEITDYFKDWKPLSLDQLTSPAKQPKNKIDYLFAYPQQMWNLIASKVPAVQLSDHLPIISEVELIK